MQLFLTLTAWRACATGADSYSLYGNNEECSFNVVSKAGACQGIFCIDKS